MTPTTAYNGDVETAPAIAQVVVPSSRTGALTWISINNTSGSDTTVVLSRLADSSSTLLLDAREILTISATAGKSTDKKIFVAIKGGDQIFLNSTSGSDGDCTAYLSGYYAD